MPPVFLERRKAMIIEFGCYVESSLKEKKVCYTFSDVSFGLPEKKHIILGVKESLETLCKEKYTPEDQDELYGNITKLHLTAKESCNAETEPETYEVMYRGETLKTMLAEYKACEEPLFTVRLLKEGDADEVRKLDCMNEYGFSVSEWCDESIGFGAFKQNQLIGYCTLGNADVCDGRIRSYPGFINDALLLSDLYIRPEFRGFYYGSDLVEEAIKLQNSANEHVFLEILDESIISFYEKCGFHMIPGSDFEMVKEKERIGA